MSTLKYWLEKYNLSNKLFYSSPIMPYTEFVIEKHKIRKFKFIINNDETVDVEFNIGYNTFYKHTGLSKWDYILQHYFNYFEINKFSNILFITNTKYNIKEKINFFYNVDNICYNEHFDKNMDKINKKKYNLISIFIHLYKVNNKDKNNNKIIYNLLSILYKLDKHIHKKIKIHFSLIPETSFKSLDLIYFLENYFNISIFTEYKLQDINRNTIEIILSNPRNIIDFKLKLSKILKIFDNSNDYGFITYKTIPKQSSIFIFKVLCKFLLERYIYFKSIMIQDINIKKIYEKIILEKIFTENIPYSNPFQLHKFVNSFQIDNISNFKKGIIVYNFVIKYKFNNIIQFGLFNAYLSIFILLALNKLNKPNTLLLSIDDNQLKTFDSIGLNIIKKNNLEQSFKFINDKIFNYIPKLFEKKKKFNLIILHNNLHNNFSNLMFEFFISLKILKKNGYIFMENINYPCINKLIKFIKTNILFLSIYYENFYANIIIFKVVNYNLMMKFIENKECDNIKFKNF